MAPTPSVLSQGTTIRGRVSGDGDFEIRGHLEGEVEISGKLTVAEGAIVRASLRAESAVLRGALVGDVTADESIVLEASARVLGNLKAPRISIALGAQIRGELDMGDVESAPARRAAPAARQAPAAPPARIAPRIPLPPARGVVVTRKPPVVPVAQAPVHAAPLAPPVETAEPRKGPPPPIVPAIKKGAKATPKKKGA